MENLEITNNLIDIYKKNKFSLTFHEKNDNVL